MWAFVLRPILSVLLLAVASFGVGNLFAKWLPPSFSQFDKLTCSWLGGLGLLSLALFLIGQVRFSVWLALLLALGPLTVSWPMLMWMKRNWGPHFWVGATLSDVSAAYGSFSVWALRGA
jgi:hypothetical protein